VHATCLTGMVAVLRAAPEPYEVIRGSNVVYDDEFGAKPQYPAHRSAPGTSPAACEQDARGIRDEAGARNV